jgi:hypothetical protein
LNIKTPFNIRGRVKNIQNKFSTGEFIKDESAVSEEFTSLPALAVVMIGFTLFILLVYNTYSAYEERIDSIKKYQTADFIAVKLTNADRPFIDEAGIVNYDKFISFKDNPLWSKIQQEYKTAGYGFLLQLRCDGMDDPVVIKDDSVDISRINNRVAVSRDVSVQLNHAIRPNGKLTVVIWRV